MGGLSYTEVLQQQQMQQAQDQAAAQLAEQQREYDIQQQQQAQTLANTQALQAKNQEQVDQQAALTDTWQTGRAAEEKVATDNVNNAFASFTPDYYKQFTDDYLAHYQPQVDQQFGQAQNQATYGLARTGNTASQTAADQYAELNRQKGVAQDDINNQAIGATTQLQTNVLNAKNNLMGQATSDAVLGSPITPGSADAIGADFNNTASALKGLVTTGGDTVSALQATPQYSSLGSLFGNVASTGAAALNGNTAYNNYQAFSGAVGASNPTSSSSGRVIQ